MAVILASVPQEGGASLGSDCAPVPYHPAPVGLLDRLGGVFSMGMRDLERREIFARSLDLSSCQPRLPARPGIPRGIKILK